MCLIWVEHIRPSQVNEWSWICLRGSGRKLAEKNRSWCKRGATRNPGVPGVRASAGGCNSSDKYRRPQFIFLLSRRLCRHLCRRDARHWFSINRRYDLFLLGIKHCFFLREMFYKYFRVGTWRVISGCSLGGTVYVVTKKSISCIGTVSFYRIAKIDGNFDDKNG